MSLIKGFLFFYVKIFIPTAFLAIALSLSSLGIPEVKFLELLALYYFIIALLVHYFVYELRYPKEYYFYYNLGLGKWVLWGLNLLTNGIFYILLKSLA